MASCNCRRKSAAPGPSSVVEALQTALLAAIPEARLSTQRGGAELVLHTGREGLLAL